MRWFCFFFTFAATASAQTNEECIAASERAQQLLNDHKLVEARDRFIVCARAGCPDAIKLDCTEQVQKTADRIPSVVIRARRVGSDIVDATVKIDGTLAAQTLDGKPIPVDPGVHALRIEAPGEAPIEQRVVVAEGEHNRVLDFSFWAAPPLATTSHRTFPVAATVFTGFTIAAFAVFGTFGVLGKNDFDAATASCSPSCTDAQVDPIRTKLLVADVALGVGVVSAITAVVLYAVHFTSGRASQHASTFSYTF